MRFLLLSNCVLTLCRLFGCHCSFVSLGSHRPFHYVEDYLVFCVSSTTTWHLSNRWHEALAHLVIETTI